MKPIRIFISSPSDVAEEREKARQVIRNLQKRYSGSFEILPVLWEDLPLGADISFQEGIDILLSDEYAVDIAVFILWSRLGSPLGSTVRKKDGAEYLSGTEREWELVLQARQRSGGDFPHILAYLREDQDGFLEAQRGKSGVEMQQMVEQRLLVDQFIQEQFHDPESGASLRAYFTFPEPSSFAVRLREHLKALLDSLIADKGLSLASWDEEPYRGLQVFDYEHAPIFFGRDREIAEVQLLLRDQEKAGCAFVIIVGASGSGKSSLARAGIMPEVIENELDAQITWRWAVFTPGEWIADLQSGLAHALSRETALPEISRNNENLEELSEALRKNPELAYKLRIHDALEGACDSGTSAKFFLLIDQLEELFTNPAIKPEQIETFLASVEVLARSGRFWILATVRSDFYNHCQRYTRLMGMKGRHGQYDLIQPQAADISRIIIEPGRMSGVRFEKDETSAETLDQRILNDSVDYPEALPLLEFALAQLYERRTPDRVLTFACYKELGGIEGALGSHAEAVFLDQPEDIRSALPLILNALVSVNEDDEAIAVRRRARIDELTDTPDKNKLTKVLVRERLIVVHRGEAYIAHEALLRRWERASRWVTENREFLRERARIAAAEKRWRDVNKDASYLLPEGRALVVASDLADRYRAALTNNELAFIEASIRRSRRRRTVRRALAASALLFLLGFCIVLALGLMRENRLKGQYLALLLAKQSGDSLSKGEIELSLLLAAESYKIYPNFETRSTLLKALVKVSPHLYTSLPGHVDGLTAIDWHPDSNSLVAGDFSGNVYFKEINTPEFRQVPPPMVDSNSSALPGEELMAVKALRWLDGKQAVGVLYQHGVYSDISQSAEILPTSQKLAPDIEAGSISPGGHWLAVAQHREDIIQLYPLDEKVSPNRSVRTWEGKRASTFAFMPGKTSLAVGMDDGSVYIANDAGVLKKLAAGNSRVQSMEWKPGTPLLAVGNVSGYIYLYDTESFIRLDPLSPPQPQQYSVTALAWHPVRSILASARSDGNIRLWEFSAESLNPVPSRSLVFKGHQGAVLEVAWSPDGQYLASGSDDRTLKLWQISPVDRVLIQLTTEQLQLTPELRALHGLDISADGSWLAAGGGGGDIFVWNLKNHSFAGRFSSGHDAPINTLAWHPTKPLLASGDANGRLLLWQWPNPIPFRELKGHTDGIWQLHWFPDGNTLASSSKDSDIRLWYLAGDAHKILRGHVDHVLGLAISPTSDILASSSTNGEIWLWSLSSGKPDTKIEKAHESSPGGLAFSPDGRLLASASNDASVALWDIATGKRLHKFPGHQGYVESVAFSPDGRFLASGGADGYLRVWNVDTFEPHFAVRTHSDHIWNVAWPSNSCTIATSSSDGSVHYLSCDESLWQQRLKSVTNRSLSNNERQEAVERGGLVSTVSTNP